MNDSKTKAEQILDNTYQQIMDAEATIQQYPSVQFRYQMKVALNRVMNDIRKESQKEYRRKLKVKIV
jgi:hypothetical protein